MPSRMSTIVRDTCAEFGVDPKKIFEDDRRWPLAHIRQETWRRVRATTMTNGKPPSYPRIGRWFGRDHTSILFGVKAAERRGSPVLDAAENQDVVRGVVG